MSISQISQLIATSLLSAMTLWSALVPANDYKLKGLVIEHPFARATPPGASSGGAYLTVQNNDKDPDRLIKASSPAAGSVELHEMAMEAGVMKMRALPSIEVRPGSKVELKPGGLHLMLLNLKPPLNKGDKVPLTLTFEKAGSIEVSLSVEEMGASGPGHTR